MSDAPKIRAGKNVVYWLVRRDLIVATTQRTGSASMAEAFGPAGTKPVRRVPAGVAHAIRDKEEKDVLLWIREPLERMVCAYDIWKNAHTPEEFCEKVLVERNAHWSPVTQLHRHAGSFLPTKLFAFDHVNETFAEETGYELPHIGARERMQLDEFMTDVSSELIDKVIGHYAEDKMLYELAKKTPGMIFAEVPAA